MRYGAIALGAEKVDVDLWLPRFRLDDGFAPVSQLEGLGLTDLSRPGTADLTVMTTTERLSVSRVLHKAFVIVDEEGTEAAAATAVIANAPGPPPRADTRTSGAESARSPSPSGG